MEHKYSKYNWKLVNVTAETKEKLDKLVAVNTTDYAKGVQSSILTRLVDAEYARVFDNR